MGRDVGVIESGSVEGLWRGECGGRSVEGCIGRGWTCRRVQVWKDASGSVEGCRWECGRMQVGVWKGAGVEVGCGGMQV